MIKLSNTDLISMSKEELIQIARKEVEEYKEDRQYKQVYQNIPRIKNLEAIEKRLQYHSIHDKEALDIRVEIKDMLNQDVYKKTEQPKAITHFSSYENYINARLRSK